MNVLQIGKYFHPARGGIENVLYNLVQGLRSRCRLEVLCFNTVAETVTDHVDGVPVTRLAKWDQFFSMPFSPAMLGWLRHRKYDVIHVHCPNPLAVLSWLWTRPAGRLVVSYHSDIVKQRFLQRIYGFFQRRFLRHADAVVVATPAHVTGSDVLPGLGKRFDVIPYGIDPALYEPSPQLDEAFARLRPVTGEDFVLFVGRLVYYKGVQFLIEAMRALPDRKLVLAGDGSHYANLRLQAEAFGDRIVFLGEVDDLSLRALYRHCALFVLPSVSRSEAFGIVQLEAMAAGKPVVSTRLPSGVPLVNADGVSGRIVEPRDSRALGEALVEILGNDALRERLGRQARERVLRDYTAEGMCARTYAMYERVVRGDVCEDCFFPPGPGGTGP